nr:uncharacterized protein LOC112749224 isoform X1 [Arachis hypogaea]XP_029148419.1 uncharacterized protein LOC112749224 isoform X1 [Arachis hypogaea]XP_029148420.1 uncharacterized protein LOC112749224 isoform X1 [Arachis hypogaea]XP_029148421.1 uncharacterized protein LOC112749224 isoform X1 [Arachis hypogaea]XP_029148422.1 uncharacterized protein LOC112749224 isoform X1 [Arachis hypogaea]XP_029148423.1 uncharacterized protein LOC112749224 isoform X1 [Arachis hypogaea]XP_029148424.1 uncharac
MGHTAIKTVISALSNCNPDLVHNKEKLNSKVCEHCMNAKMHKLPFTSSLTVYTTPLQVVYSDVWGPAPVISHLGFRYYVTFIDAFSRYTYLFLLVTKSQVFQAFKLFKQQIENLTGHKIKVLQSDNGGEYTSNQFTQFLAEQGIIQRFSCPYTPEQNGRAERKHRHLIEMSIAMLSTASMPLTYWDEAVLTATHIINRIPTLILDKKSPYETLFKSTPDYDQFRVFGSTCYPLLRLYSKTKLDFRSHRCIFIGYAPNSKGYKCLSPCGKIYITRHVQFDETSFPYKDLFFTPSFHSSTTSDTSIPSIGSVIPSTISSHYYTRDTNSTSLSTNFNLNKSNTIHVSSSNQPPTNNSLSNNSFPSVVSNTDLANSSNLQSNILNTTSVSGLQISLPPLILMVIQINFINPLMQTPHHP